MKHVVAISHTRNIPQTAGDINEVFRFLFDLVDLTQASLELITNIQEFKEAKEAPPAA